MRLNLAILALVAAALAPSAASAQEVSVTLASRYVDTSTYDDAFSNEPMLQVEASYDVTDHAYVSAYAYTGFQKPFRDDSSEYGFEVGGEWEVGKGSSINIAAGRYADYEGQGFHAGDWYAKVQLTHGPVTVSASALTGDSDTLLLYASYELPVTDRLTAKPSVAYFTRGGRVNAGLDLSYKISDRVSVGGRFVLPQDEVTHERHFYAAAALTLSF